MSNVISNFPRAVRFVPNPLGLYLHVSPEHLRPGHFVEKHLRPVTDQLHIASNMEWNDEAIAKKLTAQRKRLDLLRESLGHLVESKAIQTFAPLPLMRAMRESHVQTFAR